jgi:predicted ATP-grasp superfamily ATP-dependent carboligase
VSQLPVALVIGVDRPAGLAVVRELGRHGVPVIGVGHDRDALARSSRYLSAFHLRPPGEVAEWLPELVQRSGAGALFALGEADLVALAGMEEAALGCRILTPRAEPLAAVLDKQRTLAVAARLGVDVPRSWQPLHPNEPAPDLGWPVVVKWADPPAVRDRLAAAGLKLVKAEYCRDEASLRDTLHRYAPIGSLPLVQERCAGHGVGHMLYMEGGRAILRFAQERVHEWPAEGGVSTLCRGVPAGRDAAQMAKSEALLSAIGWEGPAMVEYRHDAAKGRFALMEVNGRFWGSQKLASASGAEFAWLLYRREILGDRTPPPAPRTDLYARHMVRETKRLARLLLRRPSKDPAFRPTPGRDLLRYLAGFLDPRMRYFVFSPGDPKPFLADMAILLRAALRKARLLPRRSPALTPAAKRRG